jgi:hypothetical protein
LEESKGAFFYYEYIENKIIRSNNQKSPFKQT